MVRATVIVCAHNPRPQYLSRVLAGLEAQTVSNKHWELLVVDSASEQPLKEQLDLSWHPHAQLFRENQPGKVAALLRGVEAGLAEILVVVDDDNVLRRDYLERAIETSVKCPMLGAWSGNVIAEFEQAPEPWTRPYLRYLAIRDVSRDLWCNFDDPAHYSCLPWGAGMVMRRNVAVYWANKTRGEQTWRAFERLGSGCGSEDTDMALTACDLGYGTGLIASLSLTHLIRAERVQERYLLKLMEGMSYSLRTLAAHRGQPFPSIPLPRLLWGHLCALRRGLREFRFYRASCRGARAAETNVSAKPTRV